MAPPPSDYLGTTGPHVGSDDCDVRPYNGGGSGSGNLTKPDHYMSVVRADNSGSPPVA